MNTYEDEKFILCWCPYHDTLIAMERIHERRLAISYTKPHGQIYARFQSFHAVRDVYKLPKEVRDLFKDLAMPHQAGSWYAVVRAVTRKYKKVLEKQMRHEAPRTYWNGKCLSYNRVNLFFSRRWNWIDFWLDRRKI